MSHLKFWASIVVGGVVGFVLVQGLVAILTTVLS